MSHRKAAVDALRPGSPQSNWKMGQSDAMHYMETLEMVKAFKKKKTGPPASNGSPPPSLGSRSKSEAHSWQTGEDNDYEQTKRSLSFKPRLQPWAAATPFHHPENSDYHHGIGLELCSSLAQHVLALPRDIQPTLVCSIACACVAKDVLGLYMHISYFWYMGCPECFREALVLARMAFIKR